ncbi:uncharacterized protein N0V89_009166 [Didymosphaeria variabile]|uniref:Uncharacterized protein n=1 Tax=Didymosphaeria variabile TaxID=1932322 RepID=A0A9W8XEJ6_9PLEO|nr:uncharacterized protein N0V89_009166 [Didymosphaeria variabile]KAJ4347796.1 hypothetical protein N0V89_009166 [Didymosphaeria variabile]
MSSHNNIQNIEPLPDHDFHSAWGCTYSARGAINNDPQTRALWLQYLSNPSSVERQFHVLLGSYTNLFADFFGSYYPISLHAHATDALLPTTIASLILNTVATSPLILESEELRPKGNEAPEETGTRIRDFSLALLGWTEAHIQAPNFIAIEGIYGAGFGPLAHTSKEWEVQAIAAGPRPVVVNLKAQPSQEDLDAQFAAAKARGAIGVVFDMVSTEDGSVLPPTQYAQLKLAAQRNRLLVIVDETMTAIRCGAPFAFQRAEYNPVSNDVQPDLVIFGKGLGISGLAIGFAGVITRNFAYKKRADIMQSILYWRAMVSRPVRLPVLLEALGVLRVAHAEDWPARSMAVGETVRDILYELEPETKAPGAVRGLGAMIALHRDVAMRLRIQSAIRRRSPWVRWLPKLDRGSIDRDLMMRHVFGKESTERRRALAEEAESVGTMPLCDRGRLVPKMLSRGVRK